MSPTEIAKRSSIPRPRVYDVLQSLLEKGLLVEQAGKPPFYAGVEPAQGLKNLLIRIEMETSRQVEEKRQSIKTVTKLLSKAYEKSKGLKLEKSKVWFTQRDAAFIAVYAEAIENLDNELLIASNSPHPPEKEILEAITHVLKKGKSVRVVRQVTKLWTMDDLESYKEYIKAGSQARYLEIKEIPLRFMVFDERDVILVFPSESESASLEALWLRISPLARILRESFEELWRKSHPILPIVKEFEEGIKKQAAATKVDGE
jgi:sugar-specific transcriptional regulator TrmB